MADHSDSLVLVDQPVGHRHRLLGLTGIVGLNQPDLLAVDAACGIEIFCCLSRTAPVLLAKRSIGPGMRTGNADNHVCLCERRNTQRDADREGQKAFSVSLLRHGLLLLKWKCCVVVEQVTCSRSEERRVGRECVCGWTWCQ